VSINDIAKERMMDTINRTPHRQFDGSDLLWLIDEYLKESSSRVAPITLSNYKYLLDYFVHWWAEVGPTQEWVVRRSSFQEFNRWLEKQESHQGESIGYNTVDTALRRLRQVFKWGYKEEFLARDYSLWIPRAEGSPPIKQAPDPDECLERLFAAANSTSKPIRDKALLAVLIGTAVRRAECVNIDIENIQFFADGSGQILIEKGKGSKPRIVIFDAIAGHFISTHLLFLAEIGIATGAMFIGHSKRMKPKSLNGVIKAIIRKAGLEASIQGPHDLRRMFATYWSRKQRGEGFTQPLSLQLGHTNGAMTLHYSKQDLSDVQRVFTSPLEILGKKRHSNDEG
jgi:integrase